MGQQTKLTQEVQELIVSALRAGNYQETAARFAGISKPTFYRWMERGESEAEEDQKYRDFRDAVEKAKAVGEVLDLKVINDAAQDGSWQAAAWKLERKFPHKWGRMVRAEVSGVDGQAIKVEVDAKTELKRLLGLLDDDPAV